MTDDAVCLSGAALATEVLDRAFVRDLICFPSCDASCSLRFCIKCKAFEIEIEISRENNARPIRIQGFCTQLQDQGKKMNTLIIDCMAEIENFSSLGA